MARYRKLNTIASTGAVIALGWLSACGTHNLEPRNLHALSVEPEVAKLSLDIASGSAVVDPANGAALDAFAADYIRRGLGPLVISAARAEGGVDDETMARVKLIEKHVLDGGLRPGEVVLRFWPSANAENTPLVLSYEHLHVTVPECGNWDRAASFNPSNTIHDNFGCAHQRALGLMVANPADLIAGRGLTSRDAARDNLVVQSYRRGEITAADKPDIEATISDVATGGGGF
jgi:pilus assembly protein CpaD